MGAEGAATSFTAGPEGGGGTREGESAKGGWVGKALPGKGVPGNPLNRGLARK